MARRYAGIASCAAANAFVLTCPSHPKALRHVTHPGTYVPGSPRYFAGALNNRRNSASEIMTPRQGIIQNFRQSVTRTMWLVAGS